MIRLDEGALICDLAETYRVYDYKALPPETVALFVCGLGENSRVKRKLSGQKLTFEQSLLALIYDKLAWLQWAQSKDGQKNRNRPESLYERLTAEPPEKTTMTFATGADFERRRNQILKEVT